jgi:hypothetical protein
VNDSPTRSRADQFIVDMLKGLVMYEFNTIFSAPPQEKENRFDAFAERIADMVQRAAKGAEMASVRHASDAELAHELESRGWVFNWDSGFLRGLLVPSDGRGIRSDNPVWAEASHRKPEDS